MDPVESIVLPMRERAEIINRWLETRLDEVVPMLMRRENIDMWVISAREYNEDPVIRSMLPATWQAARRRTILVFHDRGPDEGVDRLAIARYDVGRFFQTAWDKSEQPDQWARLASLIEDRDPERIAVNRSEMFALADGMTDTEFGQMQEALSPTYRDRIVSGQKLAVGWLETRTEEEMQVYPQIVRLAHAIIADGLSGQAIQPGVTTTEDVQWWYRDRIRELGVTAWFHPSVSIQRQGTGADNDFSSDEATATIEPGDLLHVDFGITYLRLNTDTQQHAYVLRPGESAAPEGLSEALRVGNRLQDLLTREMTSGRTGNEVLEATLAAAKEEGIDATVYTHPIGYHGHGAGPLIGLWDQQGGVPGRGDHPLYPNTAYSIELNAQVAIPEWDNQKIRIMLEEDAFFDGNSVRYLDGRQTELYVLPRH
ncbi:Xaa-Pro aminopeptidase [Longibacter salinarum]|uniref:Xaa-Pro aminopeptidase n=2 Tax=Longibacter salinarum TaxID=1850348 RepID=A0A2A8CY77_9BACT|nr:Xaa-Pro aminopeptidase [Longibacter salinarum]